MNKRVFRGVLFPALGLLAVTACAPTMQPPTSEMALANSAVERASSAGAYDYAPLELKLARDKIEQAKAALQARDYTGAQRLLEQAELDAKLAESKSGTAKSQMAVDELQKSIEAIREEIKRSRPQ